MLLSDTGTHEPWAMKTWGLPKEDKDQLQWAFREVLMPSSKTVSEICSCLMPRIPQLALDLFLLPPLRCSVHSIIFEDIGTWGYFWSECSCRKLSSPSNLGDPLRLSWPLAVQFWRGPTAGRHRGGEGGLSGGWRRTRWGGLILLPAWFPFVFLFSRLLSLSCTDVFIILLRGQTQPSSLCVRGQWKASFGVQISVWEWRLTYITFWCDALGWELSLRMSLPLSIDQGSCHGLAVTLTVRPQWQDASLWEGEKNSWVQGIILCKGEM